ncbi:MAG: response regulator [Desulfobulbaceae bacterium]|nr:response regulator [Desulfobulbaceae bacterium]HIJ89939.1 response regulator [Deltaproteobacteria bacterium]
MRNSRLSSMFAAFEPLELNGFPRRAALLVAVLGLMVLLGWVFDIPLLKSVLPGAVTMKANAGLCFLLAGGSLFLTLQKPGWQRLSLGMALAVTAISLATLSEYLFGWQPGIDQLLFREPAEALYSLYPGRMSPYLATGLFAAGFALLALPRPLLLLPMQLAASLTVIAGAVPLFSYLWNVSALTTASVTTPPAVHAVLGLILLGVALLRASLQSAIQVRHTAPLKTVEFKVLLGFIVTMLLISFGGGLTYRAGTKFAESAMQVARTQEKRAMIGDLYSTIVNAESTQRIYLLLRDKKQLAHYRQLTKKVPVLMESLEQTITDRTQLRNMAALRPLVTRRLEILAQVMAVYEHRGLAAAQQEIISRQYQEIMLDIHALSDAMKAVEIGLIKEREAATKQTRQFTMISMLITLLLAMAVLTVLFIAIRREMLTSKQAGQALLQAGALQRAVLNSANFSSIATDLKGVIQIFNVGAERMLGYTAAEVMNKITPAALSDPHGLVVRARALSEELGTPITPGFEALAFKASRGIEDIYEMTFIRKDGNSFPAVVSVSALRDAQDGIIGYLLIGIDNTVRKQNELALAIAQSDLKIAYDMIVLKNTQLIETSRTKSEFIANMSHELRTPLNAIIGFSEALKDGLMGEVAENQREYINDIYVSGEHLLSLINDILDLAKIESGKLELELEPLSVKDLVQNSLVMIKEKALNHQLKLNLEVDDEMPEIVADMRKLKQIIYNLLSNAVKFTPDGGAVTLSAKRVDGLLEISVTDTGIGISAQDQARLFHPFIQLDSALSRKYQGTGLGLLMVKRLTELHGGSVGLESEKDKGARFWMRIPWLLATDVEAPKSAETGTRPQHNAPCTPTEKDVSDTRSVLVIEDDPSAIKLIISPLKKIVDLRVICMTTGEQALEWLAHNRPDLITLDLLLPGMDGWQVLSCIKEMPHLATVPVMIISIAADGKRGFALGASQVLQKPVSNAELKNALVAIGILNEPVPPSTEVHPRVLIVDDEPSTVALMSTYLTDSGYQTIGAYTGAEGIALAHAEQPDAILLDLMMPELSGFEVIEILKKNQTTAQIPIIIITSKQLTAEDRRLLNGHVATILEKAVFSNENLATEVRRALQGKG